MRSFDQQPLVRRHEPPRPALRLGDCRHIIRAGAAPPVIRAYGTFRGRLHLVGFLTASSATGQLIFLPLLASIATRTGWRTALGTVCALLAVAAALVWLFLRDRPSDLGLNPFGRRNPCPRRVHPRRGPQRRRKLWCAHPSPFTDFTYAAAMGAGLTRTELATYLPAFMAAGALCIIAAGMTLWLQPQRRAT